MILDLTMELDENTPPYPAEGEPRFFRRLTASHDTGGFQVTELKLGTHLGTHVDAPLHSLPGGRSVAGVELNRFFGPAVCLAVFAERGGGAVSLAEVLRAGDLIRKGEFLVISTGGRSARVRRIFSAARPWRTIPERFWTGTALWGLGSICPPSETSMRIFSAAA